MAKKEIFIIGNWKMNKTISEVNAFFEHFKYIYKKECKLIPKNIIFGFAVPSPFLSFVNDNKVSSNMIVAAQNIYSKQEGSFTGEISAKMIKSVNADAVIIGHSERRQYFAETNEEINKKIKIAEAERLLSIVCIGESLTERKQDKWKTILKTQILTAFKDINFNIFAKIIIAYEPIWAIGTGESASPDQAQKTCAFLRQVINSIMPHKNDFDIIILYGGSVDSYNVADIIKQQDIDGVLVGGASLDPISFTKLLTLGKLN